MIQPQSAESSGQPENESPSLSVDAVLLLDSTGMSPCDMISLAQLVLKSVSAHQKDAGRHAHGPLGASSIGPQFVGAFSASCSGQPAQANRETM